MYYVYMLLCQGDSLYTGIAADLRHRMRQHTGQLKGGAKYTVLHPPKELAAVWTVADKSAAARMEAAIKRLSPSQKRQLTACPALLTELLPKLADLAPEYCPNLTLDRVIDAKPNT